MSIEVPEIPEGMSFPAFSLADGTQDATRCQWTLRWIKDYEDQIEDEFDPPIKITILETGRVLLENETQAVVCYMSGRHADDRLVIDDYAPELKEQA